MGSEKSQRRDDLPTTHILLTVTIINFIAKNFVQHKLISHARS